MPLDPDQGNNISQGKTALDRSLLVVLDVKSYV
jgi:hypothetical protein